MTLTKLERHSVKSIAAAINAAIADVSRTYGVKIVVGGGSFGSTKATLKCQIDIVDAAGVATAARDQFNAWAELLGLEKSDFGKRFFIKGTEYEVTGVNPGAPKFAVQGKRVYDGKEFKFPVAAVRRPAPPVSARRFA